MVAFTMEYETATVVIAVVILFGMLASIATAAMRGN
jgi:hypothetical protein